MRNCDKAGPRVLRWNLVRLVIDSLKSWLAELITLVFLVNLLELLLPSDNSRRFARVVIGLVVVLVLFSPVIRILVEEMPPEMDILSSLEPAIPAFSATGIMEKGIGIAAAGGGVVRAACEKELTLRIDELASTLIGIHVVRVEAVQSGSVDDWDLRVWVDVCRQGEENELSQAPAPGDDAVCVPPIEVVVAGPEHENDAGHLDAGTVHRIKGLVAGLYGLDRENVEVLASSAQ